MKTALLALALVSLSTAAAANTVTSGTPPIMEDYSFSTRLDIAEVISTSDYNYCGIGPRELTYLDHQGVLRTLRYQAFGDGCIDQG